MNVFVLYLHTWRLIWVIILNRNSIEINWFQVMMVKDWKCAKLEYKKIVELSSLLFSPLLSLPYYQTIYLNWPNQTDPAGSKGVNVNECWKKCSQNLKMVKKSHNWGVIIGTHLHIDIQTHTKISSSSRDVGLDLIIDETAHWPMDERERERERERAEIDPN